MSPGAISSLVAPVLLKYRVCRPRLLLAGSRAEVDPAADVGLLHGEVLLIEDSARQYDLIGGELIIILRVHCTAWHSSTKTKKRKGTVTFINSSMPCVVV